MIKALVVTSQDDAELCSRLQAGDVAALEQLYDRYSRLVYSLALRILTNPQEAEDLTQEVFLTFWRRGQYNPARGSLSSFLTTLTRSRGIDRLRSRSAKQRSLERWHRNVDSLNVAANPMDRISLQERRDSVRAALSQLPEQYRQVLELSYYEGLSQSEIAKRLETPLGTVKTWARKGLLALEKSLHSVVGGEGNG